MRSGSGTAADTSTARPEVAGLGLDAFLGHSTRGGGGNFLKDWKKTGVDVYLHRRAPVFPLWSHGWHEVVEVEEDGEKQLKVYNRRFVCHEREIVLKKQKFREPRYIGVREMPPEVCPSCFLAEWVFQAIQREELSWTQPIFSFEGDDPDYSIVVYAGGLCGLFQSDDLSKKEVEELRKVGIRRDEAFKQNMLARCQYAMSVVNANDPSGGVLTALEATALGDKLKLAIKHTIKARRALGNPAEHPYPFAWEYDDSKDFSDKYDVVALDPPAGGVPKNILDLISGEPPDMSALVTPSNCLAFRAQVEAHLCDGVELPLDEFFGEAERRGLMTAPASPPKDAKGAGRAPEVGRSAPAPSPRLPPGQPRGAAPTTRGDASQAMRGAGQRASTQAARAPESPPEPPPADESEEQGEGFQCDHCDGYMGADDLVCACGATYDEKTGRMDGRPCLNEVCRGKTAEGPCAVPIAGEGPAYICPECAALHEAFDDPAASEERKKDGLLGWRLAPQEEKASAQPQGRRRRGATAIAPAPQEPPSAPLPPAAAPGRAARAGAPSGGGSARMGKA